MRSVRGSFCVLSLAIAISACGTESRVDRTPEKLDGTPSYEFEQDDALEAAGRRE